MNKLKDAYLIDGIRTPIGKHGGSLSGVRTDDLAALVIREIVKRNPDIDTASIEDIYFGCANQAGEDNRNVARMASLLAGLPVTVPGITVNRLCASGMSAVAEAGRAITSNAGHLFIAGGVESMTRAPMVLSKAEKSYSGKIELFDTSIGWRFVNPLMKEMYGTDSMGETAENLAQKYKISREDQDLFAYNSQRKSAEAQRTERLNKEIVPLIFKQKRLPDTEFNHDEFVKPETTMEILSQLKPAFRKDGTVTAGNSSGINDGACAILVASDEAINRFKLRPRARIVTSAVTGVEPSIMGIGPVTATEKALSRSGLHLKDMDVIELNEAFAAQSLAVLCELRIDPDDKRLNPNGGAIALGHPLGMSGARLIQTAMIELEERHLRYALCTMCVGVGQGMAIIIENVSGK